MPKQLYIFLYFAFIVSSYNEKLKVGQKPTNLKGWVEYQKKIKEHESGNNYFLGYKEYKLEKLRRENTLSNFSNLISESDFSSIAANKSIFTERGPQNASGRIRALETDKSDATGNTYLAVSIGGGIWRGVFKSKNIMNSNKNFTYRIDISDNESGILILKINKKEKVLIKKVIRK